MDNADIDIGEFAEWALEKHDLKLKVPDVKYLGFLLGRCGSEKNYTRHEKKPVLRRLLREYKDGT